MKSSSHLLRRFGSLCLLSSIIVLFGCGQSPPSGEASADSETQGLDTVTSPSQPTQTHEPETQSGSETEAGSASESGLDTTIQAEPCVPRPKASWTLMFYEDGDNNLEGVLLDDVNESEAADIPEDINVIVLLDRAAGYDKRDGNWKGARLYRLLKDDDLETIHSERLGDAVYLGLSSTSDNGEELDMGSPQTLKGFIDFAMECFPADHTVLHLSDHGDGWRRLKRPTSEPSAVRGICSDDSSGKTLSISEDLPAALEGRHFDAITFDACVMGTVEVAWALSPFADFFGASVMNVPNTGFDYTTTLNGWFENPTAERWVGRSVEAFEEYYSEQNSVGFTAVDLGAMQAFGEALDALLDEAHGLSPEDFRPMRNQSYRPDPLQLSMRDTRDLLSRFAGHVSTPVLAAAVESFDALIVSKWYSSNIAKLQGLSIYAPGAAFLQGGPYLPAYDRTPFARATLWDEFIKSRLHSPPSDTDTAGAGSDDPATAAP